MEIGFDFDNFSIKKYKEILENGQETLKKKKKKRLCEEIEDLEKEITTCKNKLIIMKKLLECNKSKKEKIKSYQKN